MIEATRIKGKKRIKRAELIAAPTSRIQNLVANEAEIAAKEILEGIGNALAHGGRVEIRGFGSFGLNRHLPRIGRNPKNGEEVRVPEK